MASYNSYESMKRGKDTTKLVTDLGHDEVREYLLRSRAFFNGDLPSYICFDELLRKVEGEIAGLDDGAREKIVKALSEAPNANYRILMNKDGMFAWRPHEIIHPALYVLLVHQITDQENWSILKKRLSSLKDEARGLVESYSMPVVVEDERRETREQILHWWEEIEQRSLRYSLEFTHLAIADIADCYGSLYTHSIAWAVHDRAEAKGKRWDKGLLGNKIDRLIRSGRGGQTNGIPQGSLISDLLAEMVLLYLDSNIAQELDRRRRERSIEEVRIVRYRDDYRIFANSDKDLNLILLILEEQLRSVGFKLNHAKLSLKSPVIIASLKPDKWVFLERRLEEELDREEISGPNLHKLFLRIHRFAQEFPNSGSLKKYLSGVYEKLYNARKRLRESAHNGKISDVGVLVALTVDIGLSSPRVLPEVASVLSLLLTLIPKKEEREDLWDKIYNRFHVVPHNGYWDIWLQRIAIPSGLPFPTGEGSVDPICRLVSGADVELWDRSCLSKDFVDLHSALDPQNAIDKDKLEQLKKPDSQGDLDSESGDMAGDEWLDDEWLDQDRVPIPPSEIDKFFY